MSGIQWIYRFIFFLNVTGAVRVNVFQVVVGDSDLNGFSVAAGAYDAGFDRVALMYPRVHGIIRHSVKYFPGNFTCPKASDEMIVLLSNMYRCSLEVLTLGDFARELKTMVLASTATDGRFSDKRRFPGVISIGSTAYTEIGEALVVLMDKFRWTKISVICDSRTRDTVMGTGLLQFCSQALTVLERHKLRIDTKHIAFDSTKMKKMDFKQNLTEARKHSSIILIVSIGDIEKFILRDAYDLGMDKGKYVFIVYGFFSLPDQDMQLTSGNDDTLEKVFAMLPCTFKIQAMLPDLEPMMDDWKKMKSLTKDKYKKFIETRNVYNNIQIAAYQSVILLAQVLDEHFDRISGSTGAGFAHYFHNRTFSQPSQNITISSTGMRINDVVISYYSDISMKFEEVWRADFDNNKLIGVFNDTLWPAAFPPSSDPPCVFNCFTELADTKRYYSTILLPVALIVMFVIVLTRSSGAKWWLVDPVFVQLDYYDYAATVSFCN